MKVKMVCGVGVNDFNGTVSNLGVHIREYTLWKGMLERCYGKTQRVVSKAYTNTTVSRELLSFSYFYNFVRNLKGFNEVGWQMDKDILGTGEEYSEKYIVFVPQEINMFFVVNKRYKYELPLGVKFDKRYNKYCAAVKIGGKTKNLGYFTTVEQAALAYKDAKESHAKLLASKWKGKIDERVYCKLINFSVS